MLPVQSTVGRSLQCAEKPAGSSTTPRIHPRGVCDTNQRIGRRRPLLARAATALPADEEKHLSVDEPTASTTRRRPARRRPATSHSTRAARRAPPQRVRPAPARTAHAPPRARQDGTRRGPRCHAARACAGAAPSARACAPRASRAAAFHFQQRAARFAACGVRRRRGLPWRGATTRVTSASCCVARLPCTARAAFGAGLRRYGLRENMLFICMLRAYERADTHLFAPIFARKRILS